MTIYTVQNNLRVANNLPHAFWIEDGTLFADFYEMERVEEKFGRTLASEMVKSAEMTDKGFVWTV
jgi:hypothetical protein